LPLEILMPVEAEFGVVGDVRTELEEERAEVPVHGVDVVLVHQGRRLHQPGIGLARLGVVAALGAPHRGLLLRFADEEHAFLFREGREVFLGDLILALPMGEGQQRDALRLGEAFQCFDEGGRERLHQRRGGEGGSAHLAEEADHAPHALQLGHVDIEVQAVDALHF